MSMTHPAESDGDLDFDRSLDAPPGEVRQVSPLVRRLVAGNGGPFTFTGTCSYIVGRGTVMVIDPGPADPAHVEALLEATRGDRLAAILVTHGHADHAPGAALLAERTGAPVLALPSSGVASPGAGGPRLDADRSPLFRPDRPLADGERIAGPDYELVAVATPGHASDHVAFALPQENALFSGDHVMAWSTTVVAPPDGSMRDYMASLLRLRDRAEAIYWPGHGGPVTRPQPYVKGLIRHRRQREAAILARLEVGDATIPALVAAVYPTLAPALRGAARLSVLAHLVWLHERGLVTAEGAPALDATYRAAAGTTSPPATPTGGDA